MAATKNEAIAMLKEDHVKVKGLFTKFEEAKSSATKRKIAAEALEQLKVHAVVEEEIFYPAVREEIDDETIMDEADEEHHYVKYAVAELDLMELDDEVFEAKFKVLTEMVKHHIEEEEKEMLPEAAKAELDSDALGQEMAARKKELLANGVPPNDEEEAVRALMEVSENETPDESENPEAKQTTTGQKVHSKG